MTQIMNIDLELRRLTDDRLISDGLYLLLSSEFDRFERKVTDSEKLNIASCLTALLDPILWHSNTRSEIAAKNLAEAHTVIERQMVADSAEPLPEYCDHPAAWNLSAILDELSRRKDVTLAMRRRRMSPEMRQRYEAA
ncbi:hypothetical protein FG93_04320 [Bosea sp. LC85]|uniref:hypothetical protein n=1 Tax=Bosea sp. LC85 TaxID=1502851 RepID=UPI0004E3AD05|nr:hypothetical protein [Bosea sp. LC85]KFC66838.1 hypothetical protein FG93_04320 [Bosea sp. LC85]